MMVLLHQFVKLGPANTSSSSSTAGYHVVTLIAPIDLIPLTTTYKGRSEVRYHDLHIILNQDANRGAPEDCQEYLKKIELFPFDDVVPLIERLRTSRYLMAPTEGGI